MHQALFNSHYNLTAGESDAHSLMPVTLMVERIIEIATRHANSLEVGYEQLKNAGVGWVLSRMSLVVDHCARPPHMGGHRHAAPHDGRPHGV